MTKKAKFVYSNTRAGLQELYEKDQSVKEAKGEIPESFKDKPKIHDKKDVLKMAGVEAEELPKKRGRKKTTTASADAFVSDMLKSKETKEEGNE